MNIILPNISPSKEVFPNNLLTLSLKILNATLSNCIYNVMYNLALLTYLITSLLKKQSIKKSDQKISLCSPIILVPVSLFFIIPIATFYSSKINIT